MITRAASLIPKPWKNGGGITREIAAGPPGTSLDAFAWRLSIAEVAADGAFSCFEGVDRVLVLLDGAGMRLAEANGHAHVLDAPLALVRFAGEARIDATLIDGPTRDFNVMVRREQARASVFVQRASCAIMPSHELTFIHCARGRIDIKTADGARLTLEAGDTLQLDRATVLECEAAPDALWLHIGIDML